MKPLEEEITTVDIMIDMYCRHYHDPAKRLHGKLCESCQELSSYARQRTLKCRFGADKPTCAKCPVHCYKPQMKAEIQKVMKFSGPKMIFSHPVLAVRHLMTARKEAPEMKKRK